jgi:hypothetical protein
MVLLILVISIVASTTTTMMMMVMMFVAATRNARLDTALGLSHWARFSPDGTGNLLKKSNRLWLSQGNSYRRMDNA